MIRPTSIEYKFEEHHLILDLRKPDEAIGWFDGIADITGDREDFEIHDIWLSNTAEHGAGLILLDRQSPLFVLLMNSIASQHHQSIMEQIEEEEAAYA